MNRYDITLTTTFNSKEINLKLDNFYYSLGSNELLTTKENEITETQRKTLSGSSREPLSSKFLKIFSVKNQLINGYIYIKDNFNDSASRKATFENASCQITESLSTYDSGSSSVSINITSDNIVIDGIKMA